MNAKKQVYALIAIILSIVTLILTWGNLTFQIGNYTFAQKYYKSPKKAIEKIYDEWDGVVELGIIENDKIALYVVIAELNEDSMDNKSHIYVIPMLKRRGRYYPSPREVAFNYESIKKEPKIELSINGYKFEYVLFLSEKASEYETVDNGVKGSFDIISEENNFNFMILLRSKK